MARAKSTKKNRPVKRSKKASPKKPDERTGKLAGALCILISIYLFLAFTSYLFTWSQDQDKVLQFSWQLLFRPDLVVDNWLGRLGAIISNAFFYWGAGIASMFFVAIFGKLGIDLLRGKPLTSFWRFTRHMVLAMVFTSVAAEFICKYQPFPWGGAFGESANIWLGSFIGNAGLALLLIFTASAWFIWTFNPSFAAINIPTPSWLNFSWTIPQNWFSWNFSTAGGSDTAAVEPAVRRPSRRTVEAVPVAEAESGPETLKPHFLELYQTGSDKTEKVKPERKTDKPNIPLAAATPGEEGNAPEELTLSIDTKPQDEKPKPKSADKRSPLSTLLNIKGTDEPGKGAAQEEKPEEKQLPVDSDESVDDEVTRHVNHDPSVSAAELDNIDHSEPYDPKADLSSYKSPPLELLEEYSEHKVEIDRAELEANKDQIIETLLNYKIEITKIFATIGPTVTLYEIVPAPGVRISRIKNLEDDIALSLAALGIRIIAPMPGKGTIGIEVPNKKKQIVSLKEVIKSDKFKHAKMDLPVALGKNISNEVFVADLAKMPHLLLAGATGQGKSVGINAILVSLLYKKHPSQLKLVLIDPKKVELFPYSRLDKHFLAFVPDQDDPIITDTKKVIYTLNSLCIEMDTRYDLMKKARARNIREYNEKFVNRKLNPKNGHRFLPFIVLVIDEFADLIMTAGKEVELPIGRLAQLARAVGIHLIIATQRPSVNIITGVIKANFPVRIAYKVTSKIDSRTILDTGGAEQLIGRGDMLVSIGSNLMRLQCAFVDTPEVESVIENIGEQKGYPEPFYLPEYKDENEPIANAGGLRFSDLDDMFEDAARLVVQNQHGSTSMIQRRLKLGYNRAGRIMDQLEAIGVVGPNEGSKAREVLIFNEMDLDHFLESVRERQKA